MNLLGGQFAIITGAASPRCLGKATARLFAEHGATVAILDVDAALARAAAADIGPQHVGMACDVSDWEACQKAVRALIAQWGKVDILVNTAGLTQPWRIMDIKPGNYDTVMDVKLRDGCRH